MLFRQSIRVARARLPNAVCTVVPGFDRPVYAIISGGTAYIMNCGPQCGGTQASVSIFDLASETITSTIPVDAATIGFASGSTLYVAGTPTTITLATVRRRQQRFAAVLTSSI